MKALVKAKREPGIWMQDIALPTFGADEVLIKVKKTAICGTDVHIYAWDQWAQATIPVPMTIGHEFVGEIVDTGCNVTHLTVGQTVSAEGHIVCHQCRNCREGVLHLCPNTQGLGVNRPGCFAQYVVIPAVNVVVIPDNVSLDIASILDPLGNAVHCALSFPLVGKDVLITGAGPIGIMAVAVARHMGARHVVITDVNDLRLDMAREMGATKAINVSKETLSLALQPLRLTEGFQVGLEMSGHPSAWHDLLEHVAFGGHIAILGIPPQEMTINWQHVIFKGLFLKGIYGREMFATWHHMIAMLQSGLDVSNIITHQFDVDDYQSAFELMASGQSGKVILNWET